MVNTNWPFGLVCGPTIFGGAVSASSVRVYWLLISSMTEYTDFKSTLLFKGNSIKARIFPRDWLLTTVILRFGM